MTNIQSMPPAWANPNSGDPAPRQTPAGEGAHPPHQPSEPQQATRDPAAGAGLARKGRLLAAGLLAAARSNPGLVVDLAVSSSSALGLGTAKPPHRHQVSVQPLGKNPRPEGVEILVVDIDSYRGGHGDWTSYVANAHTDKTQDIETLLLENGLSKDPCTRLDELIQVSQMEHPPEVVSMSLGATPARSFEASARDVVQKYFVDREGPDQSKWSPEAMSAYKTNLDHLAKRMVASYERFLTKGCADGTSFSKKTEDAFHALSGAGVTVVVCAGNDGGVEATMNAAGMEVPDGLFRSIYYSNGEVLPDGVIVVGGSKTLPDDNPAAELKSNPNPAVDVLAPYHDVQVNAEGGRLSGTSFSAPIVAALAANILAINPRLKPAEVEQIILSTATPIDDLKGRARAGVVNPEQALQAARDSLNPTSS